MDAVADRDFAVEFLAAAAMLGVHLSRLGAEIVLWAGEEAGFVELDDAHSSGSSMLPQKKNPDAAELARATAPRRTAAATGGAVGGPSGGTTSAGGRRAPGHGPARSCSAIASAASARAQLAQAATCPSKRWRAWQRPRSLSFS